LRVLLGGLAGGGVIVSHVMAFLVAEPDAHDRSRLLEHSGHENWDWVLALTMGLLVLALARFATARLWAPEGASESPGSLYLYAIPRLVGLQLSCFTLLELLERNLVGDPFSHLFVEPAFLIGLLFQVLFAFVGAGLLVLLVRTIEKVVALRRAPHARRESFGPSFAVCCIAGAQAVLDDGSPRGPPLTA
jgi:hypothetical protein